ncbi:hypothetical protein NQ318_007689 [Aromia moschata]|uniref:DNA-directed DNA polymerase n=1 Tax=Aromia moschata TaxID=1265417 RepID=A0AAV8XKS6_9CUCU|nr:hypothetical protein NQ318_007689 [Aromia moschata]
MIKVNACFCGEFIKVGLNSENIEFKYFNTKNVIIDGGTDLKEWFLENFQERDSGYALHKITNLEINVNKTDIGNGSSFIKLPEEIVKKGACINVKNYNDQACFFGLFGKHFVTQSARLAKNKLARHVNLLMVQSKYFDEREQHDNGISDEEILYHFCWIKDLSRLVSSQLYRHKGKCYICDICLNYFTCEKTLNLHSLYCNNINQCKISFPKETKLSFKNYSYKEPVPYILYCDFKSMLETFSENSQTKTKAFKAGDKKIRDHCHLTGKYRDPAHESCNLDFKNSFTVPVVFNNQTGYDSHFLIKDSDKISIYTLFSIYGCIIEYIIIFEKNKLSETKLPDKEQFYNKPNGSDITDEDYEHAKTVWTAFKIQILGEYSDLYLKTYQTFLKIFVKKCLNIYQLDAAYYYTLPGSTWDCMLKYTKIELEFLQDVDMLLFIERGIRGGVSQCCNRYAKANNKFVSSYNTKEPLKYSMYFDVNSLYGWTMSQTLPITIITAANNPRFI